MPRTLVPLLVPLLVALLAAAAPAAAAAAAADPAASTVRFVSRTAGGSAAADHATVCAGARVAPALVLTTDRCARALRDALQRSSSVNDHDGPRFVVVAVVAAIAAAAADAKTAHDAAVPLVEADIVRTNRVAPALALVRLHVDTGTDDPVVPVLARLTDLRSEGWGGHAVESVLTSTGGGEGGGRPLARSGNDHRVHDEPMLQPRVELALENALRAGAGDQFPTSSAARQAAVRATTDADTEGSPILLHADGRTYLVGLATCSSHATGLDYSKGLRPLGVQDLTTEAVARFLADAFADLGLPHEQLPGVVVDQIRQLPTETPTAAATSSDAPLAPTLPVVPSTTSTMFSMSRGAAADSPTTTIPVVGGGTASATTVPPSVSPRILGTSTVTTATIGVTTTAASSSPVAPTTALVGSKSTSSPPSSTSVTSGDVTTGTQGTSTINTVGTDPSSSPATQRGSASPSSSQQNPGSGQSGSTSSGSQGPTSAPQQGSSSAQQGGSGSSGQQGPSSGGQPGSSAPASSSSGANGANAGSGSASSGASHVGTKNGSKASPGLIAGCSVAALAAICLIASLAALVVSRARQDRSIVREHSQKDWRQYVAEEHVHNQV